MQVIVRTHVIRILTADLPEAQPTLLVFREETLLIRVVPTLTEGPMFMIIRGTQALIIPMAIVHVLMPAIAHTSVIVIRTVALLEAPDIHLV
jgi:hypothetical protein